MGFLTSSCSLNSQSSPGGDKIHPDNPTEYLNQVLRKRASQVALVAIESTCQDRIRGLDPWVGTIPLEEGVATRSSIAKKDAL